MKFLVKTLTFAGAGLLLGGNLGAVVPEKYQTILDRNAFGLLPPVQQPDPSAEPVKPPLNVFVTGFATISGEKRAYFMIPPGKEPGAVQKYLTLSEGQREGSLEVITISETEGEVRIREGNSDRVLSLKENGIQPAKLAPGMKPAPMPLGPPPGMQASSPVYSPESSAGVVANQAMQQASGHPNPPNPEQMNQQMNAQPGEMQPSATPSVRTIPTRTLRVPPVQPQSNPGPQSSINAGNSLVYNPNFNSGGNYNNGGNSDQTPPAVDPAIQLAAMKEYQALADQNGGYIPVEIPNRVVNPVVAQPPISTHYVPAPPMPPLPY